MLDVVCGGIAQPVGTQRRCVLLPGAATTLLAPPADVALVAVVEGALQHVDQMQACAALGE